MQKRNGVASFRLMAYSNGRKFPAEKISYLIGMKDDSPFVFAGLWEGWKDPENGDWLHTCTIITGEPNEFVRRYTPGCRLSYQKSITILGYPVKAERRSWSLSRQTK
jgi:hypothetical protein